LQTKNAAGWVSFGKKYKWKTNCAPNAVGTRKLEALIFQGLGVMPSKPRTNLNVISCALIIVVISFVFGLDGHFDF